MKTSTIIIVIVVLVLAALGLWYYLVPNNSYQDNLDKYQNLNTPAPSNPSAPSQNNPDNEPMTGIGGPVGTPVAPTTPVDATKVKSFTLTASNFKYSVPEIRVKKGDTVKVTFSVASGMHDFVLDEFSARTQVLEVGDAAQTIQFVADKTGTFEYYCSVGTHRQMGMVGKFIVE